MFGNREKIEGVYRRMNHYKIQPSDAATHRSDQGVVMLRNLPVIGLWTMEKGTDFEKSQSANWKLVLLELNSLKRPGRAP